jgi:hypothetical protein
MEKKEIEHIIIGSMSQEELRVVVIYMSAMVPELRSKLVGWLTYMAENKVQSLMISVPKEVPPPEPGK